jgi:rhodanese-related sulfurtransferase
MPVIKTLNQFAKEALSRVQEIRPEEVQRKIHRKESLVLLDVRQGEEYRRGHLPGALLIPRGILEGQVPEIVQDTDAEVVTYCGSGRRAALSADVLQQMGYTRVRCMAGGYREWLQLGGPVEY